MDHFCVVYFNFLYSLSLGWTVRISEASRYSFPHFTNSMGRPRLLQALKFVLIFLLLGAFTFFMARPALDKFYAGGIIVEVSTDSTDGLVAPAVTFCAKDPANT